MKTKISITISENILKDIDSFIDNVYIRNRSQAIEHFLESSLSSSKVAVVLCGGPEQGILIPEIGYRPVAVVNGRTVIERAIRKLRSNGFRKVFIIARHNVLTKIFEHIKDGSKYGAEIVYVEEKKANGSADSLRIVSGRVNKNFIVVFGDIIFDSVNLDEIWNDHLKHNAIATLLLTTTKDPSLKGIVKVEGSRILEFEQKPKQSDNYLVFSPIFVCSPEIFNYSGQSLEADVFPAIARQHLLSGHLSSTKEAHIHSKKDIDKAAKASK